jgi:hypothetical protein
VACTEWSNSSVGLAAVSARWPGERSQQPARPAMSRPPERAACSRVRSRDARGSSMRGLRAQRPESRDWVRRADHRPQVERQKVPRRGCPKPTLDGVDRGQCRGCGFVMCCGRCSPRFARSGHGQRGAPEGWKSGKATRLGAVPSRPARLAAPTSRAGTTARRVQSSFAARVDTTRG